jgi:hypothetical protein
MINREKNKEILEEIKKENKARAKGMSESKLLNKETKK